MTSQDPDQRRHATWTHINAADDTSNTLMKQGPTIAVGVVFSILALLTFFEGVDIVFSAIGKLVLFVIASYVVAMVTHVWLTKAYKGGFDRHELVAAALWPYDYVRRARRASSQNTAGATRPNPQILPKLCSEKTALWSTVGASVVAFFMLIVGLDMALSVIGDVILLVVFGYLIGIVVQFWATRAYKDGLTVQEAKNAAWWPAGAVHLLRAGKSRTQGFTDSRAA